MTRPIYFIILLLLSLQLQAVHLSEDGTGQVLIFPYYTVNGGIDTLITLTNTTEETKALRVRFREAANSREVFTFNLYLGPNDMWTGAVVKSGEPAVAKIISFDQSCTYPNINSNTQQFNNLKYTGIFSDDYDDDDYRMFEGFVEVFEMGVMIGASANAAKIEDNTANDCTALNEAWGTGGYWSQNSGTEMMKPTGGITGNITLIHVGEGFAINQEPTVLENFTDTILNHNIENDSPALTESNLTADIEYNGTYASITFPTGIEAVSALLMKYTVSNEYALDEAISAKTDWIMTLPTRQYHVDPDFAESDTPIAPFTTDGLACEPFYIYKIFDREEQTPLVPLGDLIGIPPPIVPEVLPTNCYATNNVNLIRDEGNANVVNIGMFSSNHPISDELTTGDTISQLVVPFSHGWVELAFTQELNVTSNDEDFALYGLPVIGFSAQKFTNHNATPGLLAQYTGIFQHKYNTYLTRESTEFFNNGGLHIAKDNKGQVLLAPYYTVRNGLNTILSIVNTTDEVKALRIRFLEGKNSRDVLDFNIYLSPYDVWTAALVQATSTVSGHIGEPSVKLLTFDNSCTVPAINGQEFLPYAYTGEFADENGESMIRAQEGSFEIFEMGTLIGIDGHAATHNSAGVPASCPTLVGNWTPPSGKWLQSPNENVAVPDGTGGLFASVSLVDVVEGADMNYDATALASFTVEVNHTAPGDLSPNLSTGIVNQTRIITDEGAVITTWDSSINAVTALFMQSEVYNDYVVEPGIHAQTDWVNFYPSKPFYTDLLFSGSETRLVPFTQEFPFSLPENRCEPLIFRSYNRDQQASLDDRIWPATPPPLPPPQHCWGVNTASVKEPDSTNSILGSQLQMVNWAEPFGYDSIFETDNTSGWLKNIYNQSSLTGFGENGEVHEIFGLPVMGFTVSKYINSNAAPGLLANYATLNMNKGKRKITIKAQR